MYLYATMLHLTFTGSAEHKIDEKGRVSIPADFRHSLSSQLCLVISRTHRRIFGFGIADQAGIENVLQRHGLDPNDPESTVALAPHIKLIEPDATGRILLTSQARESLNLKLPSTLHFIGEGPVFSICPPDVAKEIQAKSPFNFAP